jgi:uncharacterized protein YebE (UPF0316 family)
MDTNVFDWYGWVLLPILIFLARVVDVSLGTLRIIFTSRGRRNLAPLLGFIEVFIWVAALAQLVKSAQNIVAYLGYAAGFAAGNFVGIWIEDRLALGTLVVRIIARQDGEALMTALHDAGFGVTGVNGEGTTGPVKILYTIIKRKHLHQVRQIVHTAAPEAFVSIEEARTTERGFFPPPEKPQNFLLLRRQDK